MHNLVGTHEGLHSELDRIAHVFLIIIFSLLFWWGVFFSRLAARHHEGTRVQKLH